MEQGRLFIAIALSFLIFFMWDFFFRRQKRDSKTNRADPNHSKGPAGYPDNGRYPLRNHSQGSFRHCPGVIPRRAAIAYSNHQHTALSRQNRYQRGRGNEFRAEGIPSKGRSGRALAGPGFIRTGGWHAEDGIAP